VREGIGNMLTQVKKVHRHFIGESRSRDPRLIVLIGLIGFQNQNNFAML
jgi:hypothetical protein